MRIRDALHKFYSRSISQQQPDIDLLVELVDALRPGPFARPEKSRESVKEFLLTLQGNEEYQEALRNYLQALLGGVRASLMFSYMGQPEQTVFIRELTTNFFDWLLPEAVDYKSLRSILQRVFHDPDDHLWLQQVDPADIRHILALTRVFQSRTPTVHHHYDQLLSAIAIVSTSIACAGIDKGITERLSDYKDSATPFMVQCYEVQQLVERVRTSGQRITAPDNDLAQIRVLLSQCEEALRQVRKKSSVLGTGLELTYKVNKSAADITRLRILLDLAESDDDAFFRRYLSFFIAAIGQQNRKRKVSELLSNNTDVLALQVVENAAKRGEKFTSFDKKEYKQFFRASFGGGLIVAILCINKTLIYYLHLPPVFEALFYGLNYAIGFMAIHFFKFILATKQPAMTASLIAKTIPVGKTDADSLEGLAVMISRISRSQFISFVGNLTGVIPFASALAWGFYLLAGFHIATPDKAVKLIAELHPLMSGSLYYASVAGVMLFLSGVVSGYYDNKIVYRKIPDRVRQHITLKKIFGKQRMNRFADYIDGNLGALMGNFALGMMLGSAAPLGFILGLPLDIRHITFAGGNFALGFAGLNAKVALADIAVTFLGIVGIGFFNFIVSFSLALSTAARSRNIRVLKQYKIIAAVARLFRRYPMEFIYPTKRACERPAEQGTTNR